VESGESREAGEGAEVKGIRLKLSTHTWKLKCCTPKWR